MAGDVTSIAVSYHHLGGYLRDYARQSTSALACHLASALILSLASAANSDVAVSGAAIVFQDFGKTLPPQDVADLCRQVGDIPGTQLQSADESPGGRISGGVELLIWLVGVSSRAHGLVGLQDGAAGHHSSERVAPLGRACGRHTVAQ